MDRGYKLVPEGLGNRSFDLLAGLCSDKSATKRNLSFIFKKKAMYNVLKNRNSGTRINTDTKRTCCRKLDNSIGFLMFILSRAANL